MNVDDATSVTDKSDPNHFFTHHFSHSGYVRGCAALCVIVCFTDFFGSVLTGLGLRSTDPNKKYKYYRVAIYCLVLCGNGRLEFYR